MPLKSGGIADAGLKPGEVLGGASHSHLMGRDDARPA